MCARPAELSVLFPCPCSYEDLVSAGGEKAAKEAGKLRVEGKEYVVQEADVMLFRTSA